MSRLIYIAVLFLLSCSVTDSFVEPIIPETTGSYALTIRLVDEGSNYNDLMHEVFKIPARIEEQTIVEVGVLSRVRTIRVSYTDVIAEDWTLFKLRLQNCRGVIEVIEKRAR